MVCFQQPSQVQYLRHQRSYQILEAIKEVDQGAGVFMIVKNYSGDIMNFEITQELAKMEGIEIASVVVDDDIAVESIPYTKGRRGVSGTIFVHKIQGHAAREGKSLADIKALADKIVPNIHTIGLTLSGATVHWLSDKFVLLSRLLSK